MAKKKLDLNICQECHAFEGHKPDCTAYMLAQEIDDPEERLRAMIDRVMDRE